MRQIAISISSSVKSLLIFLLLTFATESTIASEEPAKPKSLAGTWRLLANRVDSVQMTVLPIDMACKKPDRFWEMKDDGTATLGYAKDKNEGNQGTWSYSESTGRFTIKVKTVFGGFSPMFENAEVEAKGDKIFIREKQFVGVVEYELESHAKLIPGNGIEATLEFEKKVIDKEVFTELIETIPGVPKKLTVQREFLTSVTAVGSIGAEINGEAKVGNTMFATIATGFKTKIEASLGVTLGKKDSVTETYELDGKEHVKLNIKWVERYRKGTATMPDGSKVNFLVCVGLRTIPEKVK